MSKNQPKGPFCESCAMPMENPGDFGSNADGSKNSEYCHFCFEKGKFTDPNITKGQMIEKVAGIMKQMNMADSQIEQVKTFIPMLKRWR
jgi:hypothetical protein